MPEKLHLMPCKAPAVRQLPLEAGGGVRGLCCSWDTFLFSGGRQEGEELALGVVQSSPCSWRALQEKAFEELIVHSFLHNHFYSAFWDVISSAAAKVLFGSDYQQPRKTGNHKVSCASDQALCDPALVWVRRFLTPFVQGSQPLAVKEEEAVRSQLLF